MNGSALLAPCTAESVVRYDQILFQVGDVEAVSAGLDAFGDVSGAKWLPDGRHETWTTLPDQPFTRASFSPIAR